MEPAHASPSLGQLYGRAKSAFEELQTTSLASGEAPYQTMVKEAFKAFLQCQVSSFPSSPSSRPRLTAGPASPLAQIFIARGDVYSSNEALDEFSAERLRFVLVPYYLAELSQLIADDKRASHLMRAKDQFTHFLDEVERLGLLDEKDRPLYERQGAPARDPARRREEKLDGGRRKMANQKRLREIRKRMEENEKQGKDSDVGIDEELFRESVLLEIQVAINAALDGLDLIAQELPLVERMEQMKKLEAAKQGTRWEGKKEDAKKPTETKPLKIDLPAGYTSKVGPAGRAWAGAVVGPPAL